MTTTDEAAALELPCQECGGRNPAWFADHTLWNLVMGGPEAKDDPGGILCPTCFVARAGETLRITAERDRLLASQERAIAEAVERERAKELRCPHCHTQYRLIADLDAHIRNLKGTPNDR